MIRPAPAVAPIEYPSSDGEPMAENDAQRSAIMYGVGVLEPPFQGPPGRVRVGRPPHLLSGDSTFQASSGRLRKP